MGNYLFAHHYPSLYYTGHLGFVLLYQLVHKLQNLSTELLNGSFKNSVTCKMILCKSSLHYVTLNHFFLQSSSPTVNYYKLSNYDIKQKITSKHGCLSISHYIKGSKSGQKLQF